jgi:hypothetical protein
MTNNIHSAATPINSRTYKVKTFRDRDDWLRLLLAADELCPGAKVVGARVALHRNVETGQCNPTIGKLVLGTSMSESTVRRMIDELEVKGWIRVHRTRGRHSNSFELRAPTLSTVTGYTPVNRDTVEGFNPVNAERVQDEPTLSTATPQPCQIKPNPVTADTQNRESRTENRTAKEIDSRRLDLDDEVGLRNQSPSFNIDADFEEWYRNYPKHVAKGAALKAYNAVIAKKKATPDELLAGAMRAVADFDSRVKSRGYAEAHQFTRNPATWLNGQCWLDDPMEPIGSATYSAAAPGQPNHAAVAEQLARQAMAKKEAGYVQ